MSRDARRSPRTLLPRASPIEAAPALRCAVGREPAIIFGSIRIRKSRARSMICRRRPPRCRRFSSRTYPGSLLWEADPYSLPGSFVAKDPINLLSLRFFGENPRRKTSTHIQLRRRVYPQRSHVKGVSPEPLPELHERASIGVCKSQEMGEMGFVGSFWGRLQPTFARSRKREQLCSHSGLQDHADGSRKCRSRVAAGARRHATRLLPGCYRVARAQKCSGRVASGIAEVARKVGQPGGRGRRKLLRFIGAFDARREIRACTRPSCILTRSLVQTCDGVFGKSRHKPRALALSW